MMSDLADIAAAAGISIVDTQLSEGGDMGHTGNAQQLNATSAINPDGSGDTSSDYILQELEALFSQRYTEEDPDFVRTLKQSSSVSRPPCVEAYFGRRQRDNNRSWGRDRGYNDHRNGRGHRGRGDYHGNRNQRGHSDERWGRSDYNHNRNSDYHHHRDGYRDRSPRY